MISDFQAIRENLFPASHGAIEDWNGFPWHRDRTNRIQAFKAHSSQAIAIDVFGRHCKLIGLGSRYVTRSAIRLPKEGRSRSTSASRRLAVAIMVRWNVVAGNLEEVGDRVVN